MDNTDSRSGSRVFRTLEAHPSASSSSPSVYLNPIASTSAPSISSTRALLRRDESTSEELEMEPQGSVETAPAWLGASVSYPANRGAPGTQTATPETQPLLPDKQPHNDGEAIPEVRPLPPDEQLRNNDEAILEVRPLPPDEQLRNEEEAIPEVPPLPPGELPLNSEEANASNHATSPIEVSNLEEWKSWKIKYPWLSVLLATTISIIIVIAILDHISKRNNGFAPLQTAPGFLARDPEVERAIWTQGILYTSFPAFIMTLYRAMWESTVASFADRQPYVDLKKAGGRPAKATIMLDYKTEPAMWAFKLAFKNKHFVLGLCMLSSVLLALLVVPLVAFLFTTASFASNTTMPVSIMTVFNPNIGTYIPDLRLSLNSAAAIRIQDARSPPWTNDEFAFPRFIPSTNLEEGNGTIETVGYSAYLDCQHISSSEYNKTVLPPGTPGLPARVTTIEITANDRGCEIAGAISVTTIPEFPGVPALDTPTTYGKAWPTFTSQAV
ncbi:hypothetical protein B0O99DRAFT_696526 [Bisporella sp. PMI_857]|nr:hypothetical protein B0O99DRAFT_696526 [Bisporella sp. PMI_857]